MGRLRSNQQGMGMVEMVTGVAVIVLILCIGAFILIRSNSKQPAPVQQSETQKQTDVYLVIEELGVRMKLSTPIHDAYYVMSSQQANSINVVNLSTKSLDAYEQCKAVYGNSGVASIRTFKDGQTDEVLGDFAVTFPDAPAIEGVRYFVAPSTAEDCTGGKDSMSYTSIRKAFTDAYTTIERLPL